MLANVFDITSCFRLSLPCGGRLISVIHIRSMEKISTHALRGEGDLCVIARDKFKLAFQSTPSVGRATAKTYKYTTLCLYIVHIKLYIFATAVLFT